MTDNQQYQEEQDIQSQGFDNDLDVERAKNPSFFWQLNKERKIAFFVLSVFAVFAIVMWGLQFSNNLKLPFDRGSGDIEKTIVTQQEDSESSLRNKDSDGDGLSDWDELYFYKTSPYLEDSDSDGFSDKNEIDSDNDPNCPTGRNCYNENILSDATTGSGGQDLTQDIFSNITGGTGQQLQKASDLLSAPENATTLRKVLLESGFSQEMLDQISDEDLLKAYQETITQQQ